MSCCEAMNISCKDFNFDIEEKDNSLIIHITAENSEKIEELKEMVEKCKSFATENCCGDTKKNDSCCDDSGKDDLCCDDNKKKDEPKGCC